MNFQHILVLSMCFAVACSRPKQVEETCKENCTEEQPAEAPLGLSLFMRNGIAAPITLVGTHDWYLQELDILVNVTSTGDLGLDPIKAGGDFASLDWTGATQVEETWRQDYPTYVRQRYFRGAKWMSAESVFQVFQVDGNGARIGEPLVMVAGDDDIVTGTEADPLTRRMAVRQIARGCVAVNDCSNSSSYTLEGVVALRQQMNIAKRAKPILAAAVALEIEWNLDPGKKRRIDLKHVDASAYPYGYGFKPTLELVGGPANGQFFVPGESVTVRLGFFDGAGHRLVEPGQMPTYEQAFTNQVASGLRYWDPTLYTSLWYALKHREGITMVDFAGPVTALRPAKEPVPDADLLADRLVMATVANDGYSALAAIVPSLGLVVSGFSDPSKWKTPVSDLVDFKIPNDALPGTYVIGMKARRDWCGEGISRGTALDVQVGTPAGNSDIDPTTAVWRRLGIYAEPAQTGTGLVCEKCHSGPTSLAVISHGIADLRTCYGCHTPLGVFEPDNGIDIRVHFIHARSKQFAADFNDCTNCHVSKPTRPARGQMQTPYAYPAP